MTIPIQEKPFPKKNLSSILSRQKFAWIMVSIALPLLSIFTLYLFENYAGFNRSMIINSIIIVQIGYSLYLIWTLQHEGIRVNQSKLKNYKSNDMIFFTEVVNKSQLNKYYIGLILYIAFIATAIFLN